MSDFTWEEFSHLALMRSNAETVTVLPLAMHKAMTTIKHNFWNLRRTSVMHRAVCKG